MHLKALSYSNKKVQAGQVAAEVLVGRQISRRARPSTASCRKFDNSRLRSSFQIDLIFLFTRAGVAALQKSGTSLNCDLSLDLELLNGDCTVCALCLLCSIWLSQGLSQDSVQT